MSHGCRKAILYTLLAFSAIATLMVGFCVILLLGHETIFILLCLALVHRFYTLFSQPKQKRKRT